MLNIKPPTTEREFQEMMERVDHYLRKQEIPPHARPLQGWLCVSRTLQLGLEIRPGQNREARQGIYTGDDLTIRIFRWFDIRYGDKLKIHFGPGRVFILIRDDPWIITFPKVYGAIEFFISPTVPSSQPDKDGLAIVAALHDVLRDIRQIKAGKAGHSGLGEWLASW